MQIMLHNLVLQLAFSALNMHHAVTYTSFTIGLCHLGKTHCALLRGGISGQVELEHGGSWLVHGICYF